jgi:hypothetical protein
MSVRLLTYASYVKIAATTKKYTDMVTRIIAFVLLLASISCEQRGRSPNTFRRQSSGRYSQETQSQSINVPPEVMNKIRARAELDHPGDQPTQDFVIREQIDAYQWIQTFSEPRIPDQYIKSFERRAALDHPYDFRTQRFVIQEQMDAYFWMQSYSNPEISSQILQSWKAQAAQRYPNDFRVQRYLVKTAIKRQLGLE